MRLVVASEEYRSAVRVVRNLLGRMLHILQTGKEVYRERDFFQVRGEDILRQTVYVI